MAKIENLSCSECGQLHCGGRGKKFPDFCLTENTPEDDLDGTVALYRGDSEDARVARAAAEVEGEYYCTISRAEEIIAFAHRIGATRIGIASCMGLIEETRVFVKVLRTAGLEPYTVLCKVGAVDKTDIGLPESVKIRPGGFEACCNPVLQAQRLNDEQTQLNVIMGLCVGHDSLFIKHSEALVTTLVTKDRLTNHNPASPLYTTHSYSRRLLDPKHLDTLRPAGDTKEA